MKKLIRSISALSLIAGTLYAADSARLAVSGNNEIGFRIIREVVKEELKSGKREGKNIMISPVSAHYALSMAYNGTGGKTETEFAEFYGFPRNTEAAALNKANSDLSKALVKKAVSAETIKKLPAWQARPYVFTIANSLWRTNGATDRRHYEFRKDYESTLKSDYDVFSKVLDFRAKNSADVVNKWVSEKTNDMIKEIIDPDTLGDLLWVILNATYLEGSWASPFHDRGTPAQANFTLLNQEKVKVAEIGQESHLKYYESPKYQAFALPIADSTVEVWVVAPKTILDFQELQLDNGVWEQDNLQEIVAQAKAEKIQVVMPKFKFDYGFTLKEDEALTKALGINFLFKDNANFSNMDADNSLKSKVGIIKQNTRVEWDEKGIKAAAVTLIGGAEATSMPLPPAHLVKVDKPFFFAIRDSKTNAYLFLGQVADPRK